MIGSEVRLKEVIGYKKMKYFSKEEKEKRVLKKSDALGATVTRRQLSKSQAKIRKWETSCNQRIRAGSCSSKRRDAGSNSLFARKEK